MSLSRKCAIAGAYEHPTRFAPDKTMYQIMAESIRGALDDCGLTIKDVDGLLTAGMGMGGMAIVGFCDYLNLTPNFLDATNIGGSSFVAHTAHAAAAINAGLCEVAVVVYGSTAASSRFAIGTGGGGGGGDPCDQYEFPFGPTTVGAYAMIAQRHMHDYGTTSEQLAEIAVTMRLHASMNPVAKYRDPITVEDVLASRIISSPLHLLDCCIISDGGRARARLEEEAGLYPGHGRDGAARGARAARFPGDRGGAIGTAGVRARGRRPQRYRHGDDLRLVHDHGAVDAGESRLLQARRRRRVRVGRAAALRRLVSNQHRRRRPVVEPSGDARNLFGDRSDQTAARRMRPAPGQGLQNRAC